MKVDHAAEGLSHVNPSLLVKPGRMETFAAEVFLVVEKQVLMKIPAIEHCPLYLLSAYYVFNILYPKGLCSLYTLLEKLLLDKHKKKTPAIVTRLFTSLTVMD